MSTRSALPVLPDTAPTADSADPAAPAAPHDEVRRGRAAAFSDLVQRYSGRLFHFLLGLGVRGADAEDVVQDTFLRAYENIDRYDDRFRFSTWLFTIGRRQALTLLRDRRRSATQTSAAEEGAVDPAPQAGADETGLWQRAAALLTSEQYDALWMKYAEELSIREIAQRLDVSEGNARVILHRARARLAEAWSADSGTAEHPPGKEA